MVKEEKAEYQEGGNVMKTWKIVLMADDKIHHKIVENILNPKQEVISA